MDNVIVLITVKSLIVIICLTVVAILSYTIGYRAANIDNKKNKSVVGVYHFDKWNVNNTAVLLINEDGTCRLPTGSTGRWIQNGDTIKMFCTDVTENVDVIENGVGIVYNGSFYKKVS